MGKIFRFFQEKSNPIKKQGVYILSQSNPISNWEHISTDKTVSSFGNEVALIMSNESDRSNMIYLASKKVAELFDILQIDHKNDHNTRDTPMRYAKMLVCETLKGRFSVPPKITDFDNCAEFDSLIVTGPIELRSTCAHHLMPIYGKVYIGILPSATGKIIGLSKYDRIVQYFGARLQIQEELVKQIGEFIVEMTQPRGLAIRISAVHMCKTHRGVMSTHSGKMVSTTYYGDMATNQSLKSEFLQECSILEK